MPEPQATVVRIARLVLLGLALLQAWTFRHSVSPDGVAYLDLSDAVVNGRPGELVNGYWSPLYPAVIGVIRLIVSPTPLGSPYWEFAIVHLANVLAFVVALLAFEWFLRALRSRSESWGARAFGGTLGLVLAYTFFGITMLVMVSLSGTVPDLFLAAAIFATSACLLQLDITPADRKTAILLGLMMAGGALTKSIMFPLAAVIVVCLAIATARRTWSATVAAAATFLIATLPWLVALSLSVGRVTTGETGALNFAWYVNHQQPPNTGVMPKLAQPNEPLPLEGVAVMREARGTNPLWYDPTRWHRDVRPRIDPRQLGVRVASNAAYFMAILAPLVLVAAAFAAGMPWPALRLTAARSFLVVIPSLAAVAAYATTYATARYVAPFLVVSALTLAAAVPRDTRLRRDRVLLAAAVTLLLVDALSPLRGRVVVAYAVAVFAAAYAMWSGLPDWRRWLVSLATAVVVLWAMIQIPIVVVRALTLLAGVAGWYWYARRDGSAVSPRLDSRGSTVFALAGVVGILVLNLLTGWYAVVRRDSAETHPYWAAAQRVIRAGVAQGSRIAVLGNPENSGWARLARYQIVGVVPEAQAEAYARLSAQDRQRVMNAFAQAGARQLIRASP